ncbi:hypothetical protein [Bacillus cereus]|uniref:hypothetical protein n=1 Tax=Bacillus cereus TaxID=1396 RepID=UPI0018A17567|nr:hypothetical protein [Bacillus cereus]
MDILLLILLEIAKTFAREGVVFGFRKLTDKKAKRRPPICLASVGSLLNENKF